MGVAVPGDQQRSQQTWPPTPAARKETPKMTDTIAADHEQARRSPDHVINALGDVFATTETAADGSPYVRLYLMPYSNTIEGRWIAVDLHCDVAARVIAELGGALADALFPPAASILDAVDTCRDKTPCPNTCNCDSCAAAELF
jgi:hypothetical protein